MDDLLRAIGEQALLRPGAVALRHGGATLRYAELYGAAVGLAGALRAADVGEGVLVAVCYPRSFEQITGALGAMLAGGAYVPIDPGWPRERIRSLLADSGSMVLVAPEEFWGLAPGFARTMSVEMDEVGEVGPVTAEALAYVIYTSGSTGAPKGVEISHGNLVSLIRWHTKAFGVTAQDRASHLAGLGFDASVWEVWPYLAAGASVSLADDVVRTSPGMLRDWLVEEGITVAFVPTPLAEPMIAMEWPEETRLRFLLTGGDCLHHGPRAGLPFRVVNNYGPTECTVVATSGIVKAETMGMPTIGLAIAGTRVYAMGEDGREVPAGEPGELWIGGDGVGLGYRGLAEETARRFVEDRERGRMYRTGDFGCVLANGEIVFRGRVDGQVKIRGQRMELDEIVAVLNQHEGVAFSAVVARGEGEEKRLVAYVLPQDGAVLTGRGMQEHLRDALPGYMVPAVYVKLQELPLSANGKVDAGALAEPDGGNTFPAEATRGATSPVEEAVLGIVRALLKTEAVGVEDDFFLFGGHSLMGTRLVMRIREAFGVKFTLRDLFEAKTVEAVAGQVEAMLIAEMEAMSEDEAESRVMP